MQIYMPSSTPPAAPEPVAPVVPPAAPSAPEPVAPVVPPTPPMSDASTPQAQVQIFQAYLTSNNKTS